MADSLERSDAFQQLQEIRAKLEDFARRYTASGLAESWIPALDILDEGDSFRVLVDLPGVKADDLEVRQEGQQVILAGRRFLPDGTYTTRERSGGQFTRAFSLPEKVEENSAEASLKNGVLELRFAKIKS
ncbi:MAG: Hsp20/alpha crystallin family protein [Deinococcus sp.]|nr:Hsp20/alpha crystallin family protein [Deinococcus sp.]MCL5964437.1 Hsp20/alpha crystallin family protein [Deinococcus sp.]